jgi:hypothetical protein
LSYEKEAKRLLILAVWPRLIEFQNDFASEGGSLHDAV